MIPLTKPVRYGTMINKVINKDRHLSTILSGIGAGINTDPEIELTDLGF
jgi:hypothetical protein